jgi:hypothetical protein
MTGRARYPSEAIVAELRALAAELDRTPLAQDWRASGRRPCYESVIARFDRRWDTAIAAAGLPPIEPAPGWQKANGRRLYWTDDRVREALRLFRREHGRVPNAADYNRLIKGDRRFPVAQRVWRYGSGVWSTAWERAGVRDTSYLWNDWTDEDEDYLLENAGRITLAAIARHLKRSYDACHRRLYDLGVQARNARGYLTGQECARAYGVPIHRVLDLVRTGKLAAHKGAGNYWQIDPESAEACPELKAPKRTHKNTPADLGDYRQRYGLRRTKRDQPRYKPVEWRTA